MRAAQRHVAHCQPTSPRPKCSVWIGPLLAGGRTASLPLSGCCHRLDDAVQSMRRLPAGYARLGAGTLARSKHCPATVAAAASRAQDIKRAVPCKCSRATEPAWCRQQTVLRTCVSQVPSRGARAALGSSKRRRRAPSSRMVFLKVHLWTMWVVCRQMATARSRAQELIELFSHRPLMAFAWMSSMWGWRRPVQVKTAGRPPHHVSLPGDIFNCASIMDAVFGLGFGATQGVSPAHAQDGRRWC